MAGAGAIDPSAAFHVALYVLAVETLLFFAVVMHSQNCEPLLHPGVARNFGLFFLFQSASALLFVIAEQTYPSTVSQYFALLTVLLMAAAVTMSVPAALAVAFPETAGAAPTPTSNGDSAMVSRTTHPRLVPAALGFSALLLLCILVLPGSSDAVVELPYVAKFLRAKILGALAGAAVVLALASAIRMHRGLTGANGALILAGALSVIVVFGIIWALLEPGCRQMAGSAFPKTCPMPRQFDHNATVTWLLVICNALAAEGVLRLMQAGDGVQGYTSIQV